MSPFSPLRVLGMGVVAGWLTACAFGPGTGFATVTGQAVTLELPMGAGRLDEAGRWKTANGYLLALTEPGVAVTMKSVALQGPGAATTPGTGGTFDPANPPPGYSLCHGGHCHRDDGALIDYADIQAAMTSGGPATPVRVLEATAAQPTLTVGPNRPASWQLATCSPDCFLDRGTVSGAQLHLDRLTVSGTVEAGPGLPALPEGKRSFRAELPLTGQPFSAAVAAAVDLRSPAGYQLGGTLKLTDKLFDSLEWSRLAAGSGTVDLTADAATRETLLANLAKSEWKATLTP